MSSSVLVLFVMLHLWSFHCAGGHASKEEELAEMTKWRNVTAVAVPVCAGYAVYCLSSECHLSRWFALIRAVSCIPILRIQQYIAFKVNHLEMQSLHCKVP